MKKQFSTCLQVQDGSSAPELLKTEANLHPGSGFSPDQGQTSLVAGGFSSVTPESGFSLSPTLQLGHEPPRLDRLERATRQSRNAAPASNPLIAVVPSRRNAGASHPVAGQQKTPRGASSTTLIRERDLCRVRLRLLDLFKSFFDKEPDAEQLARWRGILAALAQTEVSPAFDNEAGTIAGLLWEKNLNELQNEFYRVFISPVAEGPVTTISYHRSDRQYLEYLQGVHKIMAEAGFARDPAATAPEGSLVVLLDILAALVEDEKAEVAWRARELQGRLLIEFLVPLAGRLARALSERDCADFYFRCTRLLCSYLELEMELADDREGEESEWRER